MPDHLPDPPPPTGFVVVTFAVAAVIGAAILYLGVTGHLGGPIP